MTGARQRSAVWTTVVLAVLPWIWLPSWGAPAFAAFGDAVSATTSLTTSAVTPPTGVRCTGTGLLGTSIAWNAVTGATGYRVTNPAGTGTDYPSTTLSVPNPSNASNAVWTVQTKTASGWVYSIPVQVTVTPTLLSCSWTNP